MIRLAGNSRKKLISWYIRWALIMIRWSSLIIKQIMIQVWTSILWYLQIHGTFIIKKTILYERNLWSTNGWIGSTSKSIDWHVWIHSGIKWVSILETCTTISLFLHFFKDKPFLYILDLNYNLLFADLFYYLNFIKIEILLNFTL